MNRELSLLDMHCHPVFSPDFAGFAADAAQVGLGLFANTVNGEEWSRAHALEPQFSNVRMGRGLHPWWIEDESAAVADVDAFVEQAGEWTAVGEVGLDYSKRHCAHAELQLSCFKRIVETASTYAGTVMSIHAVHAASDVLDVLEKAKFTDAGVPIFHWFSGSTDELVRARQLGCYFSVNPKMLETRRGRAYIRQIPVRQMLLETDLPAYEGDPITAGEIADTLQKLVVNIAALRGVDAGELGETLASTSRSILNL